MKYLDRINIVSPYVAGGLLIGVVLADSFNFVLIVLVVGTMFYLTKANILSARALILGILIGVTIASTLNIAQLNSELIDGEVILLGVIDSDPEYREKYQRFYLKTNDTKLLVTTDLYQDLKLGQEVVVTGKLSQPESFETDTGREFDYKNFLRARGIVGMVQYAIVAPTGVMSNSVRTKLSQLKRHYLTTIAKYLPEPESSLAGGITVGANDALGQENDDLFRRIGLTHIVVLSGYNVAIVVLALSTALAYLPYWLSAGVLIGGIWLFVLLVGGSATIVRAGIMAMIAVISRLYGSQISGLSMLSIAVTLMVIHNPLIVLYDPSFQLSVLATIGIIVVTPILEPYFTRIPKIMGLREIVVTTLATQLTVIPWIVYLIGDFSIVSPLANVLVLPIIPVAMGAVLFLYVFSSIPIVPIIATFVSYLFLSYVFKVSEMVGSWKFASLTLPPISIWLVVILYALIIIFLQKLHTVKRNQVLNPLKLNK